MSRRVPHIAVLNRSSVVTDARAHAIVQALQKQVNDDYAPAWGTFARLSFVPFDNTDPDAWTDRWNLVLLDDSDQAGALGYHDFTPDGLPLGKVFCKLDEPSTTASHELLEMLGDPDINLIADFGNMLLAYENCDAVEAEEYSIDDVYVSNFVYPSWFVRGSTGKLDHLGSCAFPGDLRPGGYISYSTTWPPSWRQGYGSQPKSSDRARVGSRRERRRVGRSELQRSER